MPYLLSYVNLIPWEKLVYYKVFCFIWQKEGKRIGERGLARPRTTCSLQSMLGFAVTSMQRLDQLPKEPHFFIFAQQQKQQFFFQTRSARCISMTWLWNLHFCMIQTFLATILLCGWNSSVNLILDIDLYTLWSSWCSRVLIQNWIQIYRIVPIGSGRLWLRPLLSIYRSYPLPSFGLQNRAHFVTMPDSAVQCTNKI